MSAGRLEEEVKKVMHSLFGVSAEARSNWDRLESLVETKVANVAAKVELLREERVGHVRSLSHQRCLVSPWWSCVVFLIPAVVAWCV